MRYAIFIFLIIGVISCNTSPKEINYGEDACHFCRMTIVDQQHAAQFITDKGKAYKFDAIECMINYTHEGEMSNTTVSNYYVNDYLEPASWLSVDQAHFIISENIPSPMGAFLSAFDSKSNAQKTIDEHGGTLYDWDGIVKKLNQ